jgi:hypothetical protein
MEGFDITEFAKMFDAALASDNPAVKKALRNFMMVAAIVHAQELNEDERLAGPFEVLLKKVQDLESMVREVQRINNSSYKEYRVNPWDYTHTGPTTRAVSTTSINTSTSEGIVELLKEFNLK